MVTQSPEQHSGLVICISLRKLIPHFLSGNNVKDHWSDSFGMVVTIAHDKQKVTFLDREANTEVCFPFFSHPLINSWYHRSICQPSAFSSSVLPFGFFDSLRNSLCRIPLGRWCDVPGSHITSIWWLCRPSHEWNKRTICKSIWIHFANDDLLTGSARYQCRWHSGIRCPSCCSA